MQDGMDWVLKILGTQAIKKKRSVRPVFPDYLSVSYDYAFAYPASAIWFSLPLFFLFPKDKRSRLLELSILLISLQKLINQSLGETKIKF